MPGISATGAPNYIFMAGTSMATPHVSAVAAYVRSIHPDWTPGAVRSWLKDTAESIGSRQAFGAGLVDADAATQKINRLGRVKCGEGRAALIHCR